MRIFLPLLVLLAASTAHATVLEIPLPELAGTYPGTYPPSGPPYGTATFHLPGIPLAIHGASLRLRGTTDVGIIRCDGSGDSPWVTETNGEMMAATYANGLHDWWVAGTLNPRVAGPFETTTPMEWLTFSNTPANWTFLDDGEGTITLSAGPAGTLIDCFDLNPPSLVVTEATLILDADFAVPTVRPTWGRIKAIYRH